MSAPFEAVKVSDHVYWVGAIDWGIRDFHGYTTSRGSTYNAYLIVADDIILVGEVLDRMDIEQVQGPLRMKYVPDDESLGACRDLGAAVAKRMKEVASE
ncbi:MAG: hypothetical protein KKE79_01735 [Actinobacteria bacterium]|nr:hypothetical protein [Actinomycetota bacterium]MBU4489335.1 hypothetical protein [Actinomycetota bacterium]